jgi:hypothetical protein
MRCSKNLIRKLVREAPHTVNIPDMNGLLPLDCCGFGIVLTDSQLHFAKVTNFLQWHECLSNFYIKQEHQPFYNLADEGDCYGYLQQGLVECMETLMQEMAIQDTTGDTGDDDGYDDNRTCIIIIASSCLYH